MRTAEEERQRWDGFWDLESIMLKKTRSDPMWIYIVEWRWNYHNTETPMAIVCRNGALPKDSTMLILHGTDAAVGFLRRHGYTSLVDLRESNPS
jgi:hypothetical protein